MIIVVKEFFVSVERFVVENLHDVKMKRYLSLDIQMFNGGLEISCGSDMIIDYLTILEEYDLEYS